MPQTFYIESDEEIISAIGRLRHSQEVENFFVFPKRALILQSIINLRLFQKEAQKMNKKIVIVTQDEIGRMLAEKAGIRTENYSDDFSQKANHLELKHQEIPEEVAPIEAAPLKKDFAVAKAETIGSTSFFTAEPEPEIPLPKQPVEEPKPQVQQLRIRNASPFRPPSLNSMRQPAPAVVEPALITTTAPPIMPKMAPQMEAIYAPKQAPVVPSMPLQTPPQPVTPRPAPQQIVTTPPLHKEKSEMLRSFFAPKETSQNTQIAQQPVKQVAPKPTPKQAVTPQQPKKASPIIHKGARGLFYFFGIVSLLVVAGVFAYLFFPKVTVYITPVTAEEKSDLQVKGVPGASDAIDSTPVRLLEREVPITVTGTATDTGSSTTEKARGTIVIYNDFSSDSQSLVATTRFEAPNGKIFRLTKNVTIPGKTTSPGAVEAEVVADQAGLDSNIDATTFTIPGFKGSDKFDKFTGKSVKAMSGGGSGGSEVKSISRADLDKAEADAKAEADKTFTKDLESSLVPGEVYLKESLQMTPLDTGNRPKEGLTGATFEYTRTYKMKAFLLQENILKKKIEDAASKEIGGVKLTVSNVAIDYGEVASNFDDNTVSIKLHATVSKVATLDKDDLKQKLLGRNTTAIEAFLAENPGVQKIQLDFKPKWFGSSIPKQPSRVDVIIE